MNPVRNPFSPGAGTRPPELCVRVGLLEETRVAIGRAKLRRPAKSMIVVGLRGVGKTVLLNEFDYMARDAACCTIVIEARELRPPPDLLAPPLRHVLLEFDRLDERFPRARFDRLTPREKHWVHAMARRTCQVLVGIGPVITAQALKLSFRVVNGCGIALFRRA